MIVCTSAAEAANIKGRLAAIPGVGIDGTDFGSIVWGTDLLISVKDDKKMNQRILEDARLATDIVVLQLETAYGFSNGKGELLPYPIIDLGKATKTVDGVETEVALSQYQSDVYTIHIVQTLVGGVLDETGNPVAPPQEKACPSGCFKIRGFCVCIDLNGSTDALIRVRIKFIGDKISNTSGTPNPTPGPQGKRICLDTAHSKCLTIGKHCFCITDYHDGWVAFEIYSKKKLQAPTKPNEQDLYSFLESSIIDGDKLKGKLEPNAAYNFYWLAIGEGTATGSPTANADFAATAINQLTDTDNIRGTQLSANGILITANADITIEDVLAGIGEDNGCIKGLYKLQTAFGTNPKKPTLVYPYAAIRIAPSITGREFPSFAYALAQQEFGALKNPNGTPVQALKFGHGVTPIECIPPLVPIPVCIGGTACINPNIYKVIEIA